MVALLVKPYRFMENHLQFVHRCSKVSHKYHEHLSSCCLLLTFLMDHCTLVCHHLTFFVVFVYLFFSFIYFSQIHDMFCHKNLKLCLYYDATIRVGEIYNKYAHYFAKSILTSDFTQMNFSGFSFLIHGF